MHASWRRAPSVPLLFLGLCVNHVVSMVLESAPPGVASQAGRSLAVSLPRGRAEDANWRLVLAKERNPKTAREEAAGGQTRTLSRRRAAILMCPLRLTQASASSWVSLALPLQRTTPSTHLSLWKAWWMAGQRRGTPRMWMAMACVVPGDTLIAVHCESAGLSLSVEAASYDFTVDAITSYRNLGPGESLTLTLGRIVRRGRALVTVVRPDGEEERFVCYEGENLRMGLLRRGLKTNDMETQRYDGKPKGSGDCGGNGLCATCVVSVLQGMSNLTPLGPSEKNLLARRFRWRQSCKAYVQCPEGQTDVELKIALSPRREADGDGQEGEDASFGWF